MCREAKGCRKRSGMNGWRMKNKETELPQRCKMRTGGRGRETEVELKLSFRCGYSSISVLSQTIFADRETATTTTTTKKNNSPRQLFKTAFEMIFWMIVCVREKEKSTMEQISII